MDEALVATAGELLESCRITGVMLTSAESCTGGLIAAYLTEVPGSSNVFERGFVTYSNEAKQELLGVPAAMLDEHGAVSEQVARAMAEGALGHARAEIALAVTGIAGPGGGSPAKPLGLVHIACARRGHPTIHRKCTFGDRGRREIRRLSVEAAFALCGEQLARPVVA